MRVIYKVFSRARWRRMYATAACCAVLGVFAPLAHALDPLTLILLRMVRDKIITAGLESAYDRANAPRPAVPPGARLPLGLDDSQLRRLIDEGFVHLDASQRGEVYSAMRAILLDPKNINIADSLVADLAQKASMVRQAHESLQKLTTERKRLIAKEARSEYEKMPPETRDQLAEALRARMVPLPNDLTDMILAEFDKAKELSATVVK